MWNRIDGRRSGLTSPSRDTCGQLVLAMTLMAIVSGCGESGPGDERLEEVRESGTLHVLTRNNPTTYYINRDGQPEGPEYDMVEAFAGHLGVETEYELVDSVAEIVDRIESGDADIGAAGISRTEGRLERIRTGPGYQSVEQQVVCRRGGADPQGVDDLEGHSLLVTAGSSYQARLEKLQEDYADLDFGTTSELTTEQLLRAVWEREIDCTVADSNLVAVTRRYYPEIEVRFSLGAPDTLTWVLPRGANRLRREVRSWYADFEDSGDMERVLDRYYGFYEVFDYVDIRRLHQRTVARLPRYEPHFRQAAENTGFDWILLAAIGYQESHWNPRARSPTGVRGLMMLTLPTAEVVGVTNRLDPVQSIHGGARYLRRMHNWLDDDIPEPDRTWLAMATYNVGMGHMQDAMGLAEELGHDPHYWRDMREVLPLLADPDYYEDLRYGYARGHEPVRYVQRIRDFQDVITRLADD